MGFWKIGAIPDNDTRNTKAVTGVPLMPGTFCLTSFLLGAIFYSSIKYGKPMTESK